MMSIATVVLPAFAQTETMCTCFCGTKSGADKISEEKMTSAQCEQKCKATGDSPVVCATTLRQYPSNNSLCFDAAACNNQNGELAKSQPSECPSGWGYCFPNPKKSEVKLSVKIGDLETVGDIGVFVAAVYKYLLEAAVIFSVIMVMVGGLQYAFGAGAQEQIAKGKERIKNGVIGLILLLCAVLIAQTVNPQILKLEVPRLSLIRAVDLQKDSCENLEAQNYMIALAEGSKKECGGVGEVKFGPDGKKVVDGLACDFTKCNTGKCLSLGQGQPATCGMCRNISSNNPLTPAKPSPSLCRSMEEEKKEMFLFPLYDPPKKGYATTSATYCQFQPGGITNIYSDKQTTAVIALSDDSCFEISLDCKQINECEDYDNVPVFYWDGGKLKESTLDIALPIMFHQICQADPCMANVKEGSDNCEWDEITDCD